MKLSNGMHTCIVKRSENDRVSMRTPHTSRSYHVYLVCSIAKQKTTHKKVHVTSRKKSGECVHYYAWMSESTNTDIEKLFTCSLFSTCFVVSVVCCEFVHRKLCILLKTKWCNAFKMSNKIHILLLTWCSYLCTLDKTLLFSHLFEESENHFKSSTILS